MTAKDPYKGLCESGTTCIRRATRRITGRNGGSIDSCGHCARGYKVVHGGLVVKIEKIGKT